MGITYFGAPKELIQLLRKHFSLHTFVETGTYSGGTATWAASYFEQVITIEASETIYNRTSSKYADRANIKFLFGNSKDVLAQIVPTLRAPAIFWLDGHWSGGETYGAKDECPIPQEIEILNASPLDHFILIDDARLFTSPPPSPHVIEVWPTIDQVIELIKAGPHEKYIVIFEDVIIAVPKAAQTILAPWLQADNTRNANLSVPQGGVRQGLALIRRGSQLIVQGGLAKAQSLKSTR